jgi:hypothetical protein
MQRFTLDIGTLFFFPLVTICQTDVTSFSEFVFFPFFIKTRVIDTTSFGVRVRLMLWAVLEFGFGFGLV